MGFKKILSAVSPVASVINKSGPVHSALKKLGGGSSGAGLGGIAGLAARRASKQDKVKTALEEGQARVAPVKAPGMKKGGAVKKGYHKMPDGRIMKDSAHKKAKAKSKATRGDGICRKGKTRGKIC